VVNNLTQVDFDFLVQLDVQQADLILAMLAAGSSGITISGIDVSDLQAVTQTLNAVMFPDDTPRESLGPRPPRSADEEPCIAE
jgi:hypothetical protein